MNDLVLFGLLAITSFFTLVNPLGVMPVFMAMTAELEPQERVRTALRATIIAAIAIILFAFVGEFIFAFFSITIDSFRIVGGVLFFIIGMDMLQARLAKTHAAETNPNGYADDISITPLAIPMICGPGALTNSILLMNDADNGMQKIVLIGCVVLVMIATFFTLYGASRIMRILGRTGINVMMRLMGLIIMVIGVEFFMAGLKPFLQDMF